MSIFRFNKTSITPVQTVSFPQIGWSERKDFQGLLRDHIDVIVPGGLVVAEEFSNWEEGRRRIDLLVVDHDRNLVVVELKRTEDGGHMELQALRYAAMISRMTLDGLVDAFSAYLEDREQDPDEARERLNQWFGPQGEQAAPFPASVRVSLVSADFSKEVTTTALWLREQGVDITCVRFRPYRVGEEFLAEVEQVIPPPDTDRLIVAPGSRQRAGRRPTSEMRLEDVYEAMPAETDRTIAHELQTFLESLGARTITTANGFVPEYPVGDFSLFPLKIRKDGKVVVWFTYLKNRRPFDDVELRRELLQRLNRIPGLQLQEGSGTKEPLSGKPSFPLSVLANPEALAAFEDVVAWVLTEARRASSPEGSEESGSPSTEDDRGD